MASKGQYTEAGGSVDVRARASGGDVLFEVADTGRGIAPEHLDRIFDKFVQIRDTGETAAGSVGLGLAMAKEIVWNYGGRIWAESVAGRGSTRRCTIPGGRASGPGKGGSA